MKGEYNSTKKWYEEFSKASAPSNHKKSEVDVISLKSEAKKHLEGETAAFQLKQSKSRDSELEWLKTALSKGTSSDKIAASIVLIQDNPKYNLARLTGLISQIKNSKHTHNNLLIESLRDLFLSDLLHPDYKLLKFEEQDLNSLSSANHLETGQKFIPRNRQLSHWYFEDQLREQYEKFITALSVVATDTVEVVREKAVAVMTDLLIANAEQEHKILPLLINKIGDPQSKVASKAVFCLNKLLVEHPNMKLVVLREVQSLLFRPNIAPRAQYYAICLLTQFLLAREDAETATNLIDVYFAFFKACLKKGEPDSRMMAAILTGVNRAYRFANLETTKLSEHIDSVYKVVHVGSFNVSLNALSLLHQVVKNDTQQENRFYTAFYRKILDPQIGYVNKQAIFLNLLYRVMNSDKSIIRLCAFVKRIRQVALQFPACMAFATLCVVQQVCQSRKDLKQMLSRPPVIIKKEEPESLPGKDENQGENEDEDDDVMIEEDKIVLSNVTSISEISDNKKDIVKIEEDTSAYYDPFVVNPMKAGATKAAATELVAFSRHYHPSVVLMANHNIEGKLMPNSGDPLKDLTLMRFLDRFSFKNPKKLDEKRVNKANDPLAVRAKYVPKGIRSLPVDSQAYLNERVERIPADELFLYEFLRKKNEFRAPVKDEESDNESVNSEEFNDLLDKFSGDRDIEELDIAGDLGPMKKRKFVDEHDDDSDGDDDAEGSDEDLGSDDSFDDEAEEPIDENLDLEDLDDMDDDASDIDFMDDNDGNVPGKVLKKNSLSKKGKKSRDNNPFMSAEEFAEMLEAQGRSKQKHGGSNMFSDADGASVKQLDWEQRRSDKLSGKFHKKRQGGFKKSKTGKKFKRS